MHLLDSYIEGLKNHYINLGKVDEWNNFISNRNKINEKEIEKLESLNLSKTFIELLKYTNGTDKDNFIFLGSDINELGYYLLDYDSLFTENRFTNDYFISIHNEDSSKIDEKIIPINANKSWLHFANCINNGSTSQLFIDVSPSRFGTYGQIIRFNANNNEFKVIANSFDLYLSDLIKNNYNFIK